jgi:lactate dehydrogenase-like 2-hydroxyacid dehydrogenase
MGKITESVISKAHNLKLIMQFGTGLEGVDIPAATRAGIKVAKIPSNLCENASSWYVLSVDLANSSFFVLLCHSAEHILYLTLCLMRNQSQMNHSLHNGNIGVPTGKTIFGSSFLIYGYGGIGQQLNSKLLSLGASTRIISRSANVSEFNRLHGTTRCEMGSPERLSDYLAQSDVVALCTTQNQHTIGLVNQSFLSLMKKGAYLINVTRVSASLLF